MRKVGRHGMTLIELVVTIAIMGMIAASATALLSTSLDVQAQGETQSRLHLDGMRAMQRMTESVARCTFLLIPNNHNPTRDILAVSGFVNDDDDYYFDDPLFPMIDEDLAADMNEDYLNGIEDFDDDGDGIIDEGSGPDWGEDDDEEPDLVNEEVLDGKDDDGDGNIDEDLGNDMNGDGAPGVAGMDDNGDGLVDNGTLWDDDEDGNVDEKGLHPVVYLFDSGTNQLRLELPYAGKSRPLAFNVTSFQVTYEAPQRVLITLTLTGDDGESVTFSEYAYVRNVLQRTGKRVR